MLESVLVPGETVMLLEHLHQNPVNSRHILQWTRHDPVLSRMHQFTLNKWPHQCSKMHKPCIMSSEQKKSAPASNLKRWVNCRRQKTRSYSWAAWCPSRNFTMTSLAWGYVWWPNLDWELENAVRRVFLNASYTRKHQWKHHFTYGSGLDNHGLDYILIMQVHIKAICF